MRVYDPTLHLGIAYSVTKPLASWAAKGSTGWEMKQSVLDSEGERDRERRERGRKEGRKGGRERRRVGNKWGREGKEKIAEECDVLSQETG